MTKNYTVSTRILRPVADVYNAIVSNSIITEYFADKCSSNLIEGKEIIWHWNEWGDFPVTVNKIVENELIELTLNSKSWHKTENEPYDVKVTFVFEALSDNETMLSISEEGWKTDEEGLIASHQNCGGWKHMAMCLKAFIEHGIDLR